MSSNRHHSCVTCRRAVALGLLAALLAAGMAAAATKPRLPLVRETFTPLPCPGKPKTTLQLKACAEKRILRTDEAINGQVRIIWGSLKTDAKRARFALAERSWLAFRRATCASRSDVHAGGTLAQLDVANCSADLNRSHVRELTLFAAALRKR